MLVSQHEVQNSIQDFFRYVCHWTRGELLLAHGDARLILSHCFRSCNECVRVLEGAFGFMCVLCYAKP